MSNKPVVFITGALAGIGRATALAFAKDGWRVAISGRREELGAELVKEIERMDAEAAFFKLDVRNEMSVRETVLGVVERFGRIDAAVNNAGVEGQMGPFVEQTTANYEEIFLPNVYGVFLCMREELRVMVGQQEGAIVNLSSIAGHFGFPGAALYAASKHAVEGLTKAAALEVAALGVKVNAVAPGPIETDMFNRFTGHDPSAKEGFAGMIPAKRIGGAQEVADAIVFLASKKSPYLTGQSVAIDGGYSAQ
jgi:NAD(P)-dependent dehydrogenase (short-subunit alcohol dehydrogenase family)